MTTSSPTPARNRSRKGWNNKRGRAEKGRADTHVTAHDGRAVCFVTGEPSGLSVTLPKALAELKKAAGPGAKIMLGFDRGGAYPQVFAHCREQHVHWVTYRRAPLAVPAMLPVITAVTIGGRQRADHLGRGESPAQGLRRGPADHPVRARQGRAADPHLRLRCVPGGHPGLAEVAVAGGELPQVRQRELRHRQDLRLRSPASRRTPRMIDNPARKEANAAVRDGGEGPGRRRARPRRAARRPGHHPRRQERGDPRRRRARSPRARRKLRPPAAARRTSPRETARQTRSTPKPASRCCAPGGAACRWCCGCSRTTPSTGSRTSLNAYLRDDDEYRAITRQTIIRGLAGTITCTPAAITVTLEAPADPASPAPWPCSSTRSTPPRPPCPATPGPSPTSSHPRPGI